MTNFTQLPDPQREVLRLLFFSPDHTATSASIAERCYYPDDTVNEAIQTLKAGGHLSPGQADGEPVHYRPSAAMLEQMQVLNRQADRQLRRALDTAKRLLDDDD